MSGVEGGEVYCGLVDGGEAQERIRGGKCILTVDCLVLWQKKREGPHKVHEGICIIV